MNATRREWIGTALAMTGTVPSFAQRTSNVTRYVRFQKGALTAHGILDGDRIVAIEGELLGNHKRTGGAHKLTEVKLLHPIVPPKVIAVGFNYRSHLGSQNPPANPEIFFKPITCLQHPGDPIVIPAESKNTHYEGELVVVIGKKASKVSPEQARDAIFGVTCGNDVSERDWQHGPAKDQQWWRAKGADTFGPCGPSIVRGLEYGKLRLRTRLNGKVVQDQSTSDLLFDCPSIISFISNYVTLEPGDLIYTGTPGSTQKLSPGDTVEVEIEGIGILRNPVVAAGPKPKRSGAD
jgi:2-keto-4-pentenoate hydratase/2-oxohepta-3-ene-1,7-dioic acid hydratase in catechol pathway